MKIKNTTQSFSLIFLTISTIIFSFSNATDPPCATVCLCENSEEERFVNLNCSRVYLSIIPPVEDWPTNTTHVDLSFNNITSLDFELSHNTIEVLDLSHNKIKSLFKTAFGGLIRLKYLNLAGNDIKKFDENVFLGLDHLESLNLSGNGLYFFPNRLFDNFIDLQELSLADNPLVYIDPIHFARMNNLRWLDVSSTGVYFLDPNIFQNNGQLEFLDLSSNDFEQVPTTALRGAKALKHLRLSENPLEVLNKSAFWKVGTLEVLELNNMNMLNSVEESTFSDLYNLRVLEMKNNIVLSSIHPLAFHGLFNESRPTLQELDLEGNSLSSLEKFMVPCAKMRKFNVQKNPWYCDCKLRWIKECDIQKVFTADLKCDMPPKVSDALIVDMNESDFECPEYSDPQQSENIQHQAVVARSTYIGVAVGLLAVLGLVLAVIFKRNALRRKKRRLGNVCYVKAKTSPREV